MLPPTFCNVMVWLLLVAVNLYHTSSSLLPAQPFASADAVAAYTVPAVTEVHSSAGFTVSSVALAQLSLAGGGGGVDTHTSKDVVCPVVPVNEYTLIL